MFKYIITVILCTFIVSIITERMVIKRLEMSEGVEIKNGRCKLKEGYGLTDTFKNSKKSTYRPFIKD